MGANASSLIGVYGDLEQSYAIAGQTLRGNAYARWDPAAQEVDFNTPFYFQVTLIGEERTTVAYQREEYDTWDDRRRSRTVTDYAYGQSIFLQQTLPLAQLNKNTPQTDLKIPFEFALPPRLPPCTGHIYSGQSSCEIRYRVTIDIIGPRGGGWFSPSKTWRHDIPILLVNPPPPQSYPVSIPPSTEVVNVCCCISRGEMTLASHIGSAHQPLGEPMHIGFEVANRSTVKVQRVIVTVKERCDWWANGHRAYRKRTLCQQIVPASALPHIKAYTKQEFRALQNGGVISARSRKQQSVSLLLPQTGNESCAGAIIQIRHTMTVKACTPCFISEPKVKATVFLFRGPGVGGAYQPPPPPAAPMVPAGGAAPLMPSAPPVPSDWRPQVMPTATAPAMAMPCAGQEVHGVQPGQSPRAPNQPDGAAPFNGAGAGVAAAPIEPTVAGLLRLLGGGGQGGTGAPSWDPVGDAKRWVAAGGGLGLTPADIAAIVGAVRLAFDQPIVVRSVMEGADAITCEHVAAAVGAAEASVKAEVASAMGPFVRDPENADRIVKPTLSPFQWQVTRASFAR